jgi:type VI secretion system protein ImpF
MSSLLKRLSDDQIDVKKQSDSEIGDKTSILFEEIMMILSSRPYDNSLSDVPLVNASILNYGISDVFDSDIPIATILVSRIALALIRFEPRLYDIQVKAEDKNGPFFFFIIEANTVAGPVRYRIMWDHVISRFSWSE